MKRISNSRIVGTALLLLLVTSIIMITALLNSVKATQSSVVPTSCLSSDVSGGATFMPFTATPGNLSGNSTSAASILAPCSTGSATLRVSGTPFTPTETEVSTVTSTPIPTETQAPKPSATSINAPEITITGQIIPAINTGADAGVGSPHRDFATASQPMEYHILDSQGKDITLAFNNATLQLQYWQKWLDANPQKDTIQLNATQPSSVWQNYSKYLTYNAIWQDFAGQWVTVSGQFVQPTVLEVNSIKLIPNSAASASPTKSTKLTARRVIVTGQIIISNYNPLPRSTQPGFGGGFVYRLKDINGQTINLYIYDSQPNNTTRIIALGGNPVTFDELKSKWVSFTGWIFSPSRFPELPNAIEVQTIQEITPPNCSKDYALLHS